MSWNSTAVANVRRLFADSFRSYTAWALAVFHMLWFLAALSAMGPPSHAAANFYDSFSGNDFLIFAGRHFHFHYEPWIVQPLMIADLPAALICSLIDLLLAPLALLWHLNAYDKSYLTAAGLFIGGSLQWLVIGSLIEKKNVGVLSLRSPSELPRGAVQPASEF